MPEPGEVAAAADARGEVAVASPVPPVRAAISAEADAQPSAAPTISPTSWSDVGGALRHPAAMRSEVWVSVPQGALWLSVRGASRSPRPSAEAPCWQRLLADLVRKGICLSTAFVLLTDFAVARLAPVDGTGTGFFGIHATTRFALARDTHEFAAGLLGWPCPGRLLAPGRLPRRRAPANHPAQAREQPEARAAASLASAN